MLKSPSGTGGPSVAAFGGGTSAGGAFAGPPTSSTESTGKCLETTASPGGALGGALKW